MKSLITIIKLLKEEIGHTPLLIIKNKKVQFITDKNCLAYYENGYSGFEELDNNYHIDITNGTYAEEDIVFAIDLTDWE
ncbi:hypothetical protein PCO87_15890 [Pectobacteriaceae bacterium C52]|nr:hypothetical protein PCO87_15890 [Pectobacteriaceae bacterium C52]